MGKQAILATFLVAATFLAVPAHGDIFNGDFSGAMTGWEDLSAANRANSASVNAGGAVLHLHSSRNYSWDDV